MGVEENIQQQRELYGEPLGDLVRRATAPLGLTQATTAKVLGLSPAMLSHLMTGQRVKIANPIALGRLHALVELGAAAGGLTRSQIDERLDEIRELSSEMTTGARTVTVDGGAAVRGVLRAVASGRELQQAVEALREVAPGLAEVLEVYGSGTDDEIRAHFASIRHLL
ncbi:transcriptional regulator with XRE-family HTH domain [Nocardioides luteus]|uniref:DNA-binding protein n=1 Tax=Nocardioides luteus TaxID=1844 RepID=A0ABQ5SX62_9ACTN|nr:DNA-binding protein [Nocardioides luteus]MDR7312496.1 transcriptional regulator with XRE-family HTH domain [Nocardioides luteus]GGR74046.1 DNA-binding protein [Nocardioides luteus]GLJ68743.1 DNA-binding protein [Nocardioides luteus]